MSEIDEPILMNCLVTAMTIGDDIVPLDQSIRKKAAGKQSLGVDLHRVFNLNLERA
jgi:hypothetical protein